MANHIVGRDAIVRELQRELVGPSPIGQELDCSGKIAFREASESYGPWRQQDSGDEILMRDSPMKRYGVGVLYPIGFQDDDANQDGKDQGLAAGVGSGESKDVVQESQEDVERRDNTSGPLTEPARKRLGEIAERTTGDQTDMLGDERDDFDLSTANKFKPNSMAVSFLAVVTPGSELVVEASGGRYKNIKVDVAGKERTWWLRSGVTLRATFRAETLSISQSKKISPDTRTSRNLDGLDLNVEVFSRPYVTSETNANSPQGQRRLITVCLINRTPMLSPADQVCIFQSHFTARIVGPDGATHILPYPGPVSSAPDEEEQSLALLYRKMKTFGVGHGCAANWGIGRWQEGASSNDQNNQDISSNLKIPVAEHDVISTMVEGAELAEWVSGEPLPIVETPSITPDITRADETKIEVSMAALAGLIPGDDGLVAVRDIIALYEMWIAQQRAEIPSLAIDIQGAAEAHLQECARCAERMRDGLTYLESDPIAHHAFQLANHAMLLQQIRSKREPRKAQFDEKAARITFSEPYPVPGPLNGAEGRGKWRAFQIGFLLMTLRSVAEGTAMNRETVELIWFPTGGGKTEAYLGLAAFSMFKSRLERPNEAGVHALMRYTLRLLTAQQFQRASGLICAMEYLRRQNPNELGPHMFSIGIWLGGGTTPNTREDARTILANLEDGRRHAENKFLLSRCPWCRAQLGPLKYSGKSGKGSKTEKNPLRLIGYERKGNTVVFKCPDISCDFTQGLPIYVIDDDIYEFSPSLVIGTVDKFALLAWKPEAQALFGLVNGQRVSSPPNIIIQDELHLISGPLGSMVGLYEALIEELCTDRREPQAIRPKIVSSTATIRRYAAQIKALYAREDVALFPPPGLDASDSFFARYARHSDGTLQRGRMYVGVHAPGLGSLQTAQVRTFTALLQASLALDLEERDPWWTLLLFFNSLRELGTTLSLFQSDIPDYLLAVKNRTGVDFTKIRRLWEILELTGRLRDEEVPEAISALEIPYSLNGERAVDVCLASNIIEVGIDIDRLSLMSIVGQPKTTSQYIQVAGRVGRNWQERPGLVVTLYGASKPRDRSHFEKFRTYHEHLYAQVEPTSVTPMSPPVLDRALHAVMAAYVRQFGSVDQARSPYPYPEQLLDNWHDLLLARVRMVDVTEVETFERIFARRRKEWRDWQRRSWRAKPSDQEIPLLRMAGEYASIERARLSWPTPMSMRDVDAECRAIITRLYALESGNSDGN